MSFIRDEKKRRATFRNRKKGLLNKLNDLVVLCDVKACAVINSPYNPIPEAWPSKEGVQEVASKFMDLSLDEQSNSMMDQEVFLRQRIAEKEAELQKYRDENHNSEMREIMWGVLAGKIDVHQLGDQLGAKGLEDLRCHIDEYLNKLNHRIEHLKNDGESSSSPLSPFVVTDTTAIASPIKYDDLVDFNAEENGNNFCVEDDHHQPETSCLAITGVEATITSTFVDASVPDITKNP